MGKINTVLTTEINIMTVIFKPYNKVKEKTIRKIVKKLEE